MSSTLSTSSPSEQTLRAALSTHFLGSSVDLTDLDEVAWSAVVGQIHTHRVIGPTMAAVRRGSVVLTDTQIETLDDIHVECLRRSLVIERMLLDVLPTFDEVGARLVLLKGTALAHLDYDDPADRTFEDADVLVDARHLDELLGVLALKGYVRDLPARRLDWDRRFAKDITMVSPWGPELDVHRTLVAGAFGFWIDLEDIHDSAISFSLAGRRVWALSAVHRALHAAYALVIGENTSRLSHAFDLAQILSSDIDVGDLVSASRAWGAAGLLSEALRRTRELLGGASLWDSSISVDRLVETRVQRWARSTYRAESGSNTMSLLSGVVALRGAAERVEYLRALLRPAAAYRDARQRAGRSREWRTGLGEIARGVRR